MNALAAHPLAEGPPLRGLPPSRAAEERAPLLDTKLLGVAAKWWLAAAAAALLGYLLWRHHRKPTPAPAPPPVPAPSPSPAPQPYPQPDGALPNCAYSRYGCCPDGVSARRYAEDINCYTAY